VYAFSNPTNRVDPSGRWGPLVVAGVAVNPLAVIAGTTTAFVLTQMYIRQNQADIQALGNFCGLKLQEALDNILWAVGNPHGSRRQPRASRKGQGTYQGVG